MFTLINQKGLNVTLTTLEKDIITNHHCFDAVKFIRDLPYDSEEEFILFLENNIPNKTRFRNLKKALLQNKKAIEKTKRHNKEEHNVVKPVIKTSDNEEKTIDLELELNKLQRLVIDNETRKKEFYKILQTQNGELADFNKKLDETVKKIEDIKKRIDDSNKKLKYLSLIKEDLQKEIDTTTSKLNNSCIYLVAPGYSGELPKYGSFFSTELFEEESRIKIQNELEYNLQLDVNDMVKINIDSLCEYEKYLKFVSLVSEFELKEKNVKVLCDNEKIQALMKMYV